MNSRIILEHFLFLKLCYLILRSFILMETWLKLTNGGHYEHKFITLLQFKTLSNLLYTFL